MPIIKYNTIHLYESKYDPINYELLDAHKIDIDLCEKMREKDILLITNCSLKYLRNIVYKYALYFKREFGYDFIQYSDQREESLGKCRAFIFEQGYLTVGAACFRYRKYDDYHGWALQWVWIHPYYRDQHIFSNAFPFFKQMFGDFYIEPPFSKTMEYLINKFYGSFDEMVSLITPDLNKL